MAKYRLLTLEELKHLQKEFVEFLAANTITADDWEKMKIQNKTMAEKLIHTFSDGILEGVLMKTEYLEKTDQHRIASIHFQSSQMVLAAMEAPIGTDADFTDPEFIQRATIDPPPYLKVFTKAENYSESREMEIFKFTEIGWLVSDGKLYKTLLLAAT